MSKSKLIKKLLSKIRKESDSDIYARMGAAGISPAYMEMYKESVAQIQKYENKI